MNAQTTIRLPAELKEELQQEADAKKIGCVIKSPSCGRDKNGVFHCKCGKCKVLFSEKSND